MAVTVHFRGVMLFRMGSGGASDSLIEALVPDCEGATPPCGTSDKYGVHHLDGTIAREHFSRMLIEPADSTIKRSYIDLRGATVEIGDMSGGNIPLNRHITGFADAAAIVPPDGSGDLLELDPNARAATMIVVRTQPGDAPVVSHAVAGHQFKLDKQAPLSLALQMEFTAGLAITVRGPIETVALHVADNTHVFIYNYDKPEPTVSELTTESWPNVPFVIDHDFKWLYSLLRPKSLKPLDEWACGYLPAPIWQRSSSPEGVGVRCVSVSTCFPARI